MNDYLALIPRPQQLIEAEGVFNLTAATRIVLDNHAEAEMGELLAEYVHAAAGLQLEVTSAETAGAIVLEQTGRDEPDANGFRDEHYELVVEKTQVRLTAPTSYGLARAIQTLRQLLARQEGAVLPCVRIIDEPRFRWRGMMMDVARHFFTVEEVCRFIDLIALHRFNRLHLHLTDDQGWRVEIRRYPKLTEVGSLRPCTLIGHEGKRPREYDSQPYGGFFTQDDIRRFVEYARRRRIELVPEIDMPGHMQAAIAAYPELGCLDATIRPRCHWGISQHILNVEPATVQFMQHVLEEVMELFPGRYIHVGGDEALKYEWAESRSVQARMLKLGLSHEDQLQAWFINQMAETITAHGRTLVGWDEILEGGKLPPSAVVMSWRGEKGGIEAAHHGNDVVMAPGSHVYFDHYQAEPTAEEPLAIGGLSTLGHVYSYEPIPSALPAEERHHVLGSQGQLWAEYIPSMKQLEYMAFPRACALAEVLWLRKEERNFGDFRQRLAVHRRQLDALNVNARPCR